MHLSFEDLYTLLVILMVIMRIIGVVFPVLHRVNFSFGLETICLVANIITELFSLNYDIT